MYKDPVVEEVRKSRNKIAAKYNYNVHAIFEAARKSEKTCGHKVVDLSKKKQTG